ncbi:MAG: ligand-binding sensor domain-containing protein, partial [bacterium]
MIKSKRLCYYFLFLIIYLFSFNSLNATELQENFKKYIQQQPRKKQLLEQIQILLKKAQHDNQRLKNELNRYIKPKIIFSTYGKYEGLSAKDISSIVQDEKGFILIGTNNGVWKYNGSDFYQIYSKRNGLVSNSILNLLFDRNGSLWVGTTQGLNYIENGVVTKTIGSGKEIWEVGVQDQKGNLWYVIDYNLIRIEKGILIEIYNELPPAFKLLRSKKNDIWVGTTNGLFQIRDKKIFRKYTQKSGLRSNNIHEIIEDHLGNIWVSDIDGGLSKIKNNLVTSSTPAIFGYIHSSYFDKKRKVMWLGSTSGIAKYDAERKIITKYNSYNGLADNYVRSIFQDKDGNLWIGTSNGLSKLLQKKAIEYTQTPKVYSQMIDHQNRKWLGTSSGLLILTGKKQEKISI